IVDLYGLIMRMYDHCAKHKVNLMDLKTMERVGIRSLKEFVDVVDRRTMLVLNSVMHPLETLADRDKPKQITAILEILERTGIEKRLARETFHAADVLVSDELKHMRAALSKPKAKKAR